MRKLINVCFEGEENSLLLYQYYATCTDKINKLKINFRKASLKLP